ncbi:hypothetical protein Q7I18_06275, partial [Aeromonas veronii]|uniref:hypothetical protein n=1 Tax=Aeromonas veronii TaxID=654 RepID=UPI003004DD9C
GYHQSAVGHLSPFIHECRTYYLNSRTSFDAIFTYCGFIGIQSPSLLLAILNICIDVPHGYNI